MMYLNKNTYNAGNTKLYLYNTYENNATKCFSRTKLNKRAKIQNTRQF